MVQRSARIMDDSWRDAVKRHKILVTIDEGCGFQKIAGLHLQGDEDPDNVKIDTIQLQPGRSDLEQKAVFDADGSLLCGEEKVATWLRQNPGAAGKVIEVSLSRLKGQHHVLNFRRTGSWRKHSVNDRSTVYSFFFDSLCPAYKDSWNVKKLYKALGADHGEVYDVEKFLAIKFRQARLGIPQWYKSSPKSLKFRRPQYWDEIRIEAMITVPCMW